MNDVIIIGAGPAGLSAALYLARYERKTLIISNDLGGQTFNAGEIENYPAIQKMNGDDLIMNMVEQVKKYENIEIKYPEKVTGFSKKEDIFTVKTESSEYQARDVIIAAGMHHRSLGIKDEEKLVGKGLSYCATCDGPFAKGKKAVVIGGGNSAASSALILAKIAESVVILNLNKTMNAEKVRIDKILSLENTKIIQEAKTADFKLTEGRISGVVYEDSESKKHEVEADVVFVEIGYLPNSDVFKDYVELNKYGEIMVDKNNSTKTEGLFAAGDITDISKKQIVIAAGDGAKAAMSVNEHLEKYATIG